MSTKMEQLDCEWLCMCPSSRDIFTISLFTQRLLLEVCINVTSNKSKVRIIHIQHTAPLCTHHIKISSRRLCWQIVFPSFDTESGKKRTPDVCMSRAESAIFVKRSSCFKFSTFRWYKSCSMTVADKRYLKENTPLYQKISDCMIKTLLCGLNTHMGWIRCKITFPRLILPKMY